MTQSQLNRAVARATGESLSTIIHRGFSIEELEKPDLDTDTSCLRPHVVDWDALDAERSRSAV